MKKKICSLLIYLVLMNACAPKNAENGTTPSPSMNPVNPIVVDKVTIHSDFLTITGQQLDRVNVVTGKTEGGTAKFSIVSKTISQIIAKVSTGFKFQFLGVNILLLSETASAQEITVPLVIEFPEGSISPASLKSVNAQPGMILVFDGKTWKAQQPEKIVTPVMHFEPAYLGSSEALLPENTIPATKAKAACQAKYPDSRQCTLNDIHLVSQSGVGPKKNGSYFIAGPSLVSKRSRNRGGTLLVVLDGDQYLEDPNRSTRYPIACCADLKK